MGLLGGSRPVLPPLMSNNSAVLPLSANRPIYHALHSPTMMKPWPPALRPMLTRPLAMAAGTERGAGGRGG